MIAMYCVVYTHSYRTAQNFDGGNIDEFDEFPAIHQHFPYQISHSVSNLSPMNFWRSDSTRNKITTSKARLLVYPIHIYKRDS